MQPLAKYVYKMKLDLDTAVLAHLTSAWLANGVEMKYSLLFIKFPVHKAIWCYISYRLC